MEAFQSYTTWEGADYHLGQDPCSPHESGDSPELHPITAPETATPNTRHKTSNLTHSSQLDRSKHGQVTSSLTSRYYLYMLERIHTHNQIISLLLLIFFLYQRSHHLCSDSTKTHADFRSSQRAEKHQSRHWLHVFH